MNKYVMIPAEQYERYKALIKSNNVNDTAVETKVHGKYERDSDTIKDNIPSNFPENTESVNDYKRRSDKKESVKLEEKKSRIIPPPGLPEKSIIQHSINDHQRGEGIKPEWLRHWEGNF